MQELQSQIDRLTRRILMMVTPVRITTTDDTGLIHTAQVGVSNTPEILDKVPVAHYYGFHANVPPDTDAIAIFGFGNRANPMIVGHNNTQYRPKNYKAGEVSLYSMWGDSVKLGENNTHTVTTKTSQITGSDTATMTGTNQAVVKSNTLITIDAPTVHVTGRIQNPLVDALEARIAELETRLRAVEARSG